MHWVFNYPWGESLTWLAVTGVVMAVAASFALVWRQLWPISAAGIAIVLLRLAAFAIIVFLLLQPHVVYTKTDETKPNLAVLIDTSGSMSVVDKSHEKPRLREAVDALSDSKIIDTLGEKSKLSVFEFATGLSRVKADSLDKLDKAKGTGTSMGMALSQVGDEFKGEDLAGVVIFSDGRDNTGSDPLRAAQELKAPVYTVGFGRVKEKEEIAKEQDLSIVSVGHDKRVVAGHTTDITVTVASKGFGARSVPVELLLDDQVLAQSAVALSPERPERKVTMTLTPQAPGQFVYTIRVPVDPAESNKANNEKPIPIFVTDPVSRVLYVEARPRWEFKFVSRVLSAYKNVEHTSLVRTGPNKVIIQGSNPVESAQIATMTPDQLQRLKAIIIGDVPRTFFTPEQLGIIAAVVEQGGAVMLLAGQESFGADGFANTPLAQVLPAQLVGQASYVEKHFRVELTPEGKAHPAFQDVKHDWRNAPELLSMVGVGGIKPGATVLMKATDGSDAPIVIVHRYGKGKAVMVLADCTWRWKLGMAEGGVDADLQTIFWRQLISWLMPEETAEKEKRAVQLIADKLQYELNEQVTLTVTALDAEGKPAREGKVVCQVYAPDGKVIERAAVYGKIGQGDAQAEGFVADFTTHVSGKYKVIAMAQSGGVDLGRDEISFIVGDTSIEMNETDPNRELLETLAKSTKGRYYEPQDAAKIVGDVVINTKRNTWTEKKEVWDEWWVFVTFVGLVCSEWVIRRTRQLE